MATTAKGYPYPTGTDRVVDGDNVIAALATDVDGWLGTSACGQVSTPGAVVAGTAYAVAVTFPVGRFAAAPYCQATGNGSAVNAVRQPCINNVSATGMTLNVGRDAGTASIGTFWLAAL